jgi:hypothetical protein
VKVGICSVKLTHLNDNPLGTDFGLTFITIGFKSAIKSIYFFIS